MCVSDAEILKDFGDSIPVAMWKSCINPVDLYYKDHFLSYLYTFLVQPCLNGK